MYNPELTYSREYLASLLKKSGVHFSAVCRSSDAKTKENSFHFAGKDIACKEI